MNSYILKITDAFLAYQANKTTLGELEKAIDTAVVNHLLEILPEEKNNQWSIEFQDGWNACIDEVKQNIKKVMDND